MLARRPYDDTDIPEEERRILEPLVPEAQPGGRPRTHKAREDLNAVFYMVRGGCAWRLLPHEFPPWKTVYHYFRLRRLKCLLFGDEDDYIEPGVGNPKR